MSAVFLFLLLLLSLLEEPEPGLELLEDDLIFPGDDLEPPDEDFELLTDDLDLPGGDFELSPFLSVLL